MVVGYGGNGIPGFNKRRLRGECLCFGGNREGNGFCKLLVLRFIHTADWKVGLPEAGVVK